LLAIYIQKETCGYKLTWSTCTTFAGEGGRNDASASACPSALVSSSPPNKREDDAAETEIGEATPAAAPTTPPVAAAPIVALAAADATDAVDNANESKLAECAKEGTLPDPLRTCSACIGGEKMLTRERVAVPPGVTDPEPEPEPIERLLP
jgi:hypothetical protein